MSSIDPPISQLMRRAQRDRDAENELASYFWNQGIAAAKQLMSEQLQTFVQPEDIAGAALRSAISDLSNCRVSPTNRNQFFRFLWSKIRQKVIDASRSMNAVRRDPSRTSPLNRTELQDLSTLAPRLRSRQARSPL